MKSTNGLARLLALLISLVMVAAACSSDDSDADAGDSGETATSAASDDGGSDEGSDDASGGGDAPAEDAATGEPIRIGAVTSESGLTTFPESAAAAQLVFDRYNAAGGLDGRPIELIVVDDQDTAEGAASAARSLVEEQMVDALCCGGSIVDCTTNGGYYAEMEMEVVMGVAACAEAATVHPVNTGPFLPALHALDYFAIDLGLTNICAVGQQAPITELFVNIFFPLWSDVNGIELNVITSAPGEDLTPTVTKLAADGCEAVFAAYTEPVYQSFFQIVNAQGLGEEIEFAMLTSGYSLSLLDAAGPNLEGVYAASEFAPYTGDASTFPDAVNDFLALIEGDGQAPTSFGQAGYLSANVMIAALESIEGEVNRESINEAIRNLTYESELLGGPFTATGFVGGVQPNPFSLMVQVQDGQFVQVNDFQTFPRQG